MTHIKIKGPYLGTSTPEEREAARDGRLMKLAIDRDNMRIAAEKRAEAAEARVIELEALLDKLVSVLERGLTK